MRRIAVRAGTEHRQDTIRRRKPASLRMGMALLLLIAVACSSSGSDYLDDYLDIRDELAPPEPAGELVDERTESFVDVANPCDATELITVDLEELVYDQGDGTVLIINRSEVSTPSGFQGTGSFWMLVTGPDEPPLDSGYFESAENTDTGGAYVRYGAFPGPFEGEVYESVCIGDA